jgi:hypothetical protein
MTKNGNGLDPEGLVTFEAAGEKFTAVFGFRAMKAVETYYELPFFRALQQAMPALSLEDATDKAKIAEAGASVRFTDIGKLFECSLLKHHPGLTEEKVEDLIDEIGLEKAGAIIGATVAAALVREGDESSNQNPPKASRGKRTG